MKSVSVLLVVCQFFLTNGEAEHDNYEKTLHGCSNRQQGREHAVIIDRDEPSHPHGTEASTDDITLDLKINHLEDTHNQLVVHWVGNGSKVIVCLARDPDPTALYISYDDGNSYQNKTNLFKVSNQTYAILEKFYKHPTYDTHLVFTDIKNNLFFVTTNHGQDIKKITLDFSPIQVSFHEIEPSVFIVLDQLHRLWVTEDFGNTFRQMQDSVRSFHWVKENDSLHSLVVQRMETDGYHTIFYSNDLFLNGSGIVRATNISDFCVRDDYLFTTKVSPTGVLELYVSYKLGKEKRSLFQTKVDIRSYFIVDVTSNRALVVVSDSDIVSHLYVSDYLDDGNEVATFTLSLENVLCYFLNSTWNYTWIHRVPENAFADIYKVEGLSGIYIASRVVPNNENNNVSLSNLRSYITFDHGQTWRLIQAPERDVDGHPISCSVHNCSLHLNLEFNQRYSSNRSTSILSSKSAPGIIIATGVLGKSLDGHRGIYVSTDAGLTWRQALNDSYLFSMGDHGGILTAIEYSKSNRETRHILYSTDEGEKWLQAKFHRENIKLYKLTTEPGENTTVFTVFGSVPKDNQWIIFKLELNNAFKYNCSKEDYTTWPSSNQNNISCVLGQQLTHQRRNRHANCYSGENFDTSTSIVPCSCDFRDYLCDFGFIRSDVGHCVRNPSIVDDPYKVPLTCKPDEVYNRTKGYRKIPGDVCIDGVEDQYLPEEVPCPSSDLQPFLLVSLKRNISKYNLITKKLDSLPLKKLENVITFDFDIKSNCVYWADNGFKTIERQCLNSNESEILVSSDLGIIEGMALDWISNNLYFVDTNRLKIELISTDIRHSGIMRRTVVGPTDLRKPKDIALHPRAGYMFWTDRSAENPAVNRADLDGTNIKKLFGYPHLSRPNGITVDYIAERIYWVDTDEHSIASSDLHGHHFKYIIRYGKSVTIPVAIAVFKNKVYWTEWRNNAIFSSNKDGPDGREVLESERFLFDLKLYAHGIRTGSNSCTNSSCSHICVGKPGKGKACLCPDDMELKNSTCHVNPAKPLPNITNPVRCGSEFVTCDTQMCSSDFFRCGSGECIPPRWHCDHNDDCLDGSDEKDCPTQNCTKQQFGCDNGRCIPSYKRCDGSYDCSDKSDEQDCAPCEEDDFDCKLGFNKCILRTQQCDGTKDCINGLDEMNCENKTCSNEEFSCGGRYNVCILHKQVCDGIRDCFDGKDEMNCSTRPTQNEPCQLKWMFKCPNQKCIAAWWACDGVDDCGDGSDEVGCYSTTIPIKPPVSFETSKTELNCTEQQFGCDNDKCIPAKYKCDGDIDCNDTTDELYCDRGNASCKDTEFGCILGSRICIPLQWQCDGQNDCVDGSDEMNCTMTTTLNYENVTQSSIFENPKPVRSTSPSPTQMVEPANATDLR